MKIKPILTVITLLACISNAGAETCTTTTTSTAVGHIPNQAKPYLTNCRTISYTNYYSNGTIVYSTPQCTRCINSSYKLITLYNNSDQGADWTATCQSYNPSFTICAKPCDSSCVDDTYYDTEDTDGSVENRIHRACKYSNKLCEEDSTWYVRCRNGYYGIATGELTGDTGCEQCPKPPYDPDHYTANSAAGEAESITDCFISKGSAANYFRDITGTYKCTEDAYYKL